MGLSLEHVYKSLDKEIHLSNINLDIESGSKTVVLGRTLAGKTSLLRIMAGLDRPTRGSLVMDHRDITGVPVRKRSIAMVYQQFINYPSFTVFDNIASPLKVAKMDRAEIQKRVTEVAEILHLTPMLDRLPAELSGGQQQRTAIARALVKDTQLLLMDEPLVNLDYKLREELQTELQEIFKHRNAMVVYTTTEPCEALKLGGNIVVMDQGKILQTGPTTQVYREPSTLKVAEVFSDPPINYLACRVEGEILILNSGDVLSLSGHLKQLTPGSYILGIRSNNLFLKAQDPGDLQLTARVKLAEINGSETFIHVDCSGERLVVQEVGIVSLKIGSNTLVFMNPANFFVFS
ncbi:MAG: ABC transporter ATP-binding protein [Desulfobacter sp.]|nr:MAG: ABC transporter ATP-binding protein [Desulfobacter sp.]